MGNDNGVISYELIAFEEIYDKTKNGFFFFTQLVSPSEARVYSLYYRIYRKIYLSLPLPKDTIKLEHLLDRIIAQQSALELRDYDLTLLDDNEEDTEGVFDAVAEEIRDIPLDEVKDYIKPEFVEAVLDKLRQMPADQRLCLVLCCFRGINIRRAALLLNITLGSIKHKLYLAHKSLEELSPMLPSRKPCSPLSYLPLVLRRAQQSSSVVNTPPDFMKVCEEAIDPGKKKGVDFKQVEETLVDYHTPDALKPEPSILPQKTFMKIGIATCITALSALVIFASYLVIKYTQPFSRPVTAQTYTQDTYSESPVEEISLYEESADYDEYINNEESSEYEETEELNDFIFNEVDGGVEIIGYTGENSGDIILPENTVVIGEYAFADCYGLTSVTIPDGVKIIGDYAFYGCLALRGIEIPDGVTSIGNAAFENCYYLDSIVIPDSVTSIGYGAFRNCSDLMNVEIPGAVTIIEDYTFEGCSGLTSVEIPGSVTSIGYCAFNGCSNLMNITSLEGVTSIDGLAFYECNSLATVSISDMVTSIGDSAFESCDALTSIDVSIDNEYYSSINGVLFDKDKTILICYPAGKENASYTIPSGVKSIGKYAFFDCTDLTSVTIPDTVTSIDNDAFAFCETTIKCSKNSYAMNFAIRCGISYELID